LRKSSSVRERVVLPFSSPMQDVVQVGPVRPGSVVAIVEQEVLAQLAKRWNSPSNSNRNSALC
jgi:hypothetical protein